MCQLVLVLLAVVAGYAGAATIERCCSQKMVGGVNYTLVESKSTAMWGCHSDCVFERVDTEGSRFCFKAGDLEVVCEDDYPGFCRCNEVVALGECLPYENGCGDRFFPVCWPSSPPNCGGCSCEPVPDDAVADYNIKCPIFNNTKFMGPTAGTVNPVNSFTACQVQCKKNPTICNFWSWDSNGIVGNQLCSMFEADTGRTFPAGWFSGSIVTDCTTG
eukprot:GFUD01025054.1.p1 GENE.GFUD01025054.1~~GFUD01025054.1.p1  ORF type:complete len:236 (+),score=19.64 GFUD01025054.1:58-708(+)